MLFMAYLKFKNVTHAELFLELLRMTFLLIIGQKRIISLAQQINLTQTNVRGSNRKAETVTQKCSVKKVFLKISQNSQENTCVRISFLIRLHVESSTFIKQGNPAQVFTFKFCEVFKNSSFIEHLWWLLLERAKNCDPL